MDLRNDANDITDTIRLYKHYKSPLLLPLILAP